VLQITCGGPTHITHGVVFLKLPVTIIAGKLPESYR